MLQYPTNVYPDGATFDALLQNDDNKIKFTFNGDYYTGALYKIYNYDTGEFIKNGEMLLQSREPQGFNGDDIASDAGLLVMQIITHWRMVETTCFNFNLFNLHRTAQHRYSICLL